MLSLRGVSKAFGAVQALSEVSVECRPGEIHALVGENGSGKSTLLGIASGFLAPDEGLVEIGGTRLRTASPARARRLGLGIAYQDYSHVLDLTVAENLCLAVPREVRPPYHRMERWAKEQLALFDLDVRVGTSVSGLSLAERQLLEVVKALLTRPKVLLLDEPTEGLAPIIVEELLKALGSITRSGGICSIIVEQNAQKILGLADRVVILERGAIVHDAASSALKADPAALERHLGVAGSAAH